MSGSFFILPLKGQELDPPREREMVFDAPNKKGKVKVKFLIGVGINCVTCCRLYKENKCLGTKRNTGVGILCNKALQKYRVYLTDGICPKEYYIDRSGH